MRHGTPTGYKQHRRDGIPFPEDAGGISCGCQMANRLAAYKYRHRDDYTRVPCVTCGIRRVIKHERDGQCAECWQRAEQRRLAVERMRYDREMNSPEVLEPEVGRWVTVGLVKEWHEYEPGEAS